MDKSATAGRGALAAAAGTALSRLTGFVRLAALVYAIGVAEDPLTDTFTLANTTPNIIYELVLGGALSAIVLRVFVEVKSEHGEEEAWTFIARLTNLAMLTLGFIALIGIVITPAIMKLYTLRAPDEVAHAQQQVGSLLLMMFIPQILFYGLNTIATAVLRAQRRFGVVSLAPVLNNLAATATFIGFASLFSGGQRTLEGIPLHGIVLLGGGTTSGVILLGLVPWFYSKRRGRMPIRKAGLRDPRIMRIIKLYSYTLGYVATNQAGLWITLVLANQLRGAVAARDAAFTLFQLPHGLMAVSVSIVAGTALTERAVAGDLEGFGSWLLRGLRAISFVVLPAVAGYLAIAPQIVRLLLEHGLAGAGSTELIAAMLRAYCLGLLFFSWWHLILTAFQGLGDTRTPMLINLGGFALQVVVMTTLFVFLDGKIQKASALALAHAASYLLTTIVGLTILGRRIGSGFRSSLQASVAKSLAGSAAVGIVAWGIAKAIEARLDMTFLANQAAQILMSVGGGLLIYWAAARILGMEELQWVKTIASRR